MTQKRENKFTSITLDETIALFDRLILNSPITIGDANYVVNQNYRRDFSSVKEPIRSIAMQGWVKWDGSYLIGHDQLSTAVIINCSQGVESSTVVNFAGAKDVDKDEFNLIHKWVVDRIDAERAN